MHAPSIPLTCPRCSATHALTGRAPGEPFTCPCGNILTVPAGAGPSSGARRRTVRIALAVLAGALLLGGGMAATGRWPRSREQRARDLGAEVGKHLYTLCTNVAALRDETGRWTPAGPQPPDLPRGAEVAFPREPTFERLQFDPGPGPFQYEVVVDGNPEGDARVRCVARGDPDGDGVISEATLEIDENGMLRPVRWDGGKK